MSDAIDQFREKIRRRAIVMEIGGFRPPHFSTTSWFGRVGFGMPGEAWPMTDGKPMLALCQLNVIELPFRPPRLDDLAFLTVFISGDELPEDEPNGTSWCLRAYRDLSQLVPLNSPEMDTHIKPFPMRPTIVEADYPCHEDLPVAEPDELEGDYYDLFQNVPGFKLGGWPSLIQSEIYWAPFNRHPISPEYVFQIDATEKGNWMWGDNGVGHFGRGTVAGRTDEWACEWQCY